MWLNALVYSEGDKVAVSTWFTPTLPAWIRYFALSWGFDFPLLYTFVVPLFAGILAVFFVLRAKTSSSYLFIAPVLAGLSLFTSPFGWTFDASLLLVVPVGLLAQARGRPGCGLVFALVSSQVLALLTQQILSRDYQYFVWFPPLLAAYWFFWAKPLPMPEAPGVEFASVRR
jgi:hypothetical protein